MMELKKELFAICSQYVNDRIQAAENAIANAQASANEEGKSSAGDKYETGRAMMQLEIEKNMVQLAESQKLKQILSYIKPGEKSEQAELGSLVITDSRTYYISISLGEIDINGSKIIAVAPAAPLAKALMGKTKGTEFSFNNQSYRIKEVW